MEKAPAQRHPTKTDGKQKSPLNTSCVIAKQTAVNDSPDRSSSRVHNGLSDHLLHLQRVLGNRAVSRLIQAKLIISQPNDPYEREADQVADTVMRMPEPEPSETADTPMQTKSSAARITPLVQRETEVDDDEKEDLEVQPTLQRELGDGTEDEEDDIVATKPLIQRMPVSELEEDEEEDEEGEPVQAGPLVQRQAEEEEAELAQAKSMGNRLFTGRKTPIQPKGASAQTPQASSAIAANIHALKGGGSPLPQSTREFFEPRLGADFSQVRVHTDSRAAETTKSIHARAFTVGRDIAFGTGRYAPHSREGRQLLAHELTHVVQQNGTQLQRAQPQEMAQVPRVSSALEPNGETNGGSQTHGKGLSSSRPNGRSSAVTPNLNLPFIQRDEEKDVADADVETELNDRFYDYVDDFEQIAIGERDTQPLVAAEYRRAVLLMNHKKPDVFVDEDERENFLGECEYTAESEDATLNALGETGDRMFKSFPEAFPEQWAEDVEVALDLGLDVAERLEAFTSSKQLLDETLAQVPEQLLSYGLPLNLQEALTSRGFELKYEHNDLNEQHIVKSYAQALNRTITLRAALAFCLSWNGQAKSYAERVRKGQITVSPNEYELFFNEFNFLQSLPDHIARTSDPDDRRSLLEGVLAGSYGQFTSVVIVAVLQALGGGVGTWEEGKGWFADKLAEADKAIQGESYWERVWRAIEWAEHRNYFIASLKELWQAIVENAAEIIGTAAVFTGAMIAVQFVPVLNVVVDIIFLLWGGYEILKAIMEVKQVLDEAGDATSVVRLQRASAKMANLSADKLLTFIEFIVAKGAHKLTKAVRNRAKKLREKNKDMTDDEVVEQATKEVREEEKATKSAEELPTKEQPADTPERPADVPESPGTKKTEYVNNNPKATGDETKIGEMLHEKAESGELPGVNAVEGAAEIKGKRSGDYRLTMKNGDRVPADLYQPQSGNPRSIELNIFAKSGQAEVVIVELGAGNSGAIDTVAARKMARNVVDTPGHNIDRVVVTKNGKIIADESR